MKPLTVDVEDYRSLVARDLLGVDLGTSAKLECEMKRVLDLLDKLQVRATCFVVGRVARDKPQMVKDIAARGHEIASHSQDHLLMERHSPRSFEWDLKESIGILEDITGAAVHGFRAPAFSLGVDHLWAFDIMASLGVRYDSSVRLVWPWGGASALPLLDAARAAGVQEYPGLALGWRRLRAPLGGGGGLRHLPAPLTRWGVERVRRAGYSPFVYIHPYDLTVRRTDVRWPAAGLLKRLRCAWFDWHQRRGRSKVEGMVAYLSGTSWNDPKGAWHQADWSRKRPQ